MKKKKDQSDQAQKVNHETDQPIPSKESKNKPPPKPDFDLLQQEQEKDQVAKIFSLYKPPSNDPKFYNPDIKHYLKKGNEGILP